MVTPCDKTVPSFCDEAGFDLGLPARGEKWSLMVQGAELEELSRAL